MPQSHSCIRLAQEATQATSIEFLNTQDTTCLSRLCDMDVFYACFTYGRCICQKDFLSKRLDEWAPKALQ